MAELEKAGVPTVAFVDQTFQKDWHGSAGVFGIRRLAKAVVPRPFVGLAEEDVYPYVDGAFDDIIKGLTTEQAFTEEEGSLAAEVMAIEGEDRYDAFEQMNRLCLERGWGDGFPLWAPTRERVDAMLAGTRRAPTDVIATLPPGMGLATVEKIAINAVMAGCKPEHLPLLLASVDAINDPHFMLRGTAQSTGAHAPFMLVNGPLVKKLGINSGRCALGPGAQSAVNTALGRAMRLIFMNIGHAYPGVMDMDTLGSPTKYSMCLGENDEASPWEPYHVEKGFDRDASVVTMQPTYGLSEVEDNYGNTPELFLDTVASNACARGIKSVGYWLLGQRADPIARVVVREKHMLLVCPVHAEVFRKHGWSKDDIRQYFYKRARMPFRELIANLSAAAFRKSHPDLQWLWDSADTPLPILDNPDRLEIVVAGGMGGRSTYSLGAAEPVSRLIDEH